MTNFQPGGFSLLRSPDGDLNVTASQDTVTPSPNLVRGFGQEDISFAEKGMTPFDPTPKDQVDWSVPLVIAQGNWEILPPAIDYSNVFAAVFAEATSTTTPPADILILCGPTQCLEFTLRVTA